jgi:ATP-binding cassette subfamily B (MDR/TAP) protein 1
MMAICTASAIGAGIAMPMMFYIFGNIVSDFVGYFMPLTTITKDQFLIAVNRNT